MANLARNVGLDYNALLIGLTGSGKSYFTALMVMSRVNEYDRIVLMTSKTADNILYRIGAGNKKFCYIDYSVVVLEQIWEMLVQCRNVGRPMKILLVLDDILGNLDLKSSSKTFVGPDGKKKNIWQLLASQSRHMGLTVWFLLQTLTTSVIPAIRLNSRYHFYFSGLNVSQLKACYEYLPGTSNYENFEDFKRDYSHYTRAIPYAFVFNDRSITNRDKNLFFCNPIKYDDRGIYFTEIRAPEQPTPPSFERDIRALN